MGIQSDENHIDPVQGKTNHCVAMVADRSIAWPREQVQGEIMKIRLPFLSLAAALAFSAGCVSMPNQCADCKQHHPIVQRHTNVLPPAEMLRHPGPGVDGPGPGVIPPFSGGGPGMCMAGPGEASQLAFSRPDGMSILFDVGGQGMFDSEPLIAPARYNFPQGAIYRLKLSNIPGRPGVELYPSIEVGAARPRTEAYLAHNAIPIEFTEEDFDQVLTGNFVTKVIYLPDAEFQELAVAGVETLVSTRLDPGLDPIVEADRRGSIMCIVRLGNKDLQGPVAGGVVGGVMQTSYARPVAFGAAGCGPQGCGPSAIGGGCGPAGCGPTYGGMPPAHVCGVTAPMYGMPSCGTPIGLPGPPHIPLGIPAGLQCHTIENHTHMSIPGPTEHVHIDVKQEPGLSYPKPASNISIVERTHVPPVSYHQPAQERVQVVPGAPICGQGGNCENN